MTSDSEKRDTALPFDPLPILDPIEDLYTSLATREGAADAPEHRFVQVEEMPSAARDLLAHRGHMTVTLERRVEGPVRVEVLAVAHDEPRYTRQIRLHSEATGEPVMFGVMRFDFRTCSPDVRRRILDQNEPLGRILIDAGMLRTVQLHKLVRLDPAADALASFDLDPQLAGPDEALWGRIASIHCDGLPAVDLLEILAPALARD